ncbi:hypothetical protein Y032_0144g2438 [Ancylostoma ceylanicum]|nr:hypothetical protein Y032_0144g2438 [Ancylostoma ceylanicum]
MIFIPFALLLTLTSTEVVRPSSLIPPCPPGWSQFLDSCYHIENRTMSLPKAEKRCASKGATLFVANSLEEFDNITRLAPRNLFSWIGLAQFEERTSPIWQTTSRIDPSSL